MGSWDRAIRVAVAVLIVILFIANVISGTAAIVLLIISAIFLITSFFSFCPGYLPFNFSTKRKKTREL